MRIFLSFVFCMSQVLAGSSGPRLFWTDKDDEKIESSDLDGGNRVMILEGLTDPRGIAVDQSQGKMFWAAHDSSGAIYWANCDGSDMEVFIDSLSNPADLALDLENRMIYWAAEGSGAIQRASLDGGRTVETVLSGLGRPYYIALDGGFVYWSYFNSGVIERASREDGTNRSVVVSGQDRVRDVEIADGFIYWCDRDTKQLRRREIDGNGVGQILYANGILDRPHGLVLDPITNTMFWTDTETQLVASAAMDGTGAPVTLAMSSSAGGPWAIELVRPLPLSDPYESWQWDHFTNAELEDVFLESSVWGEMADPDEDGRTNLLEYAQGTDPRSSANRSRSLTIGANDHSQVVLRMRIDDPALTYTLEAIEDLSSASWISGLFAEVGGRVPDLEDAAYEFVTMEAEKVEKLFVRLRVTR